MPEAQRRSSNPQMSASCGHPVWQEACSGLRHQLFEGPAPRKQVETQRLPRRLDSTEKALVRTLQPDELRQVFSARKQAELLERNKRTEIHDQKLSRLLPKKPPGYDCKNVFNLSSKTLTDGHVSLLSKGLDFALAPRAVPKREIIVEIEDRLRHIKDSTGVNLARSRIATVLNNVSGPPSNLSKQERSALRDLRSDKSVIVLPADKGKGTVILDTEDYRTKMQEILDDAAHFVPLAHDPTAKAERSLVDHLRQLKKKGHLDDVTYRRLFSSDGATPRIYGLPKIHKPGCPLRPIVSFIGSPTYNLSKYLVELVTPVTGNNNLTVRNSKEFVELVRTQAPSNNDVMVSFDVVSLFTNVPKDLAVQVAEDRLRKDSTLPSRTSLTVEEVAILLRFCLNQTHFCFNGKCYHQIEGCPMGSPVSVTLANLVMEHIEETAMERFSRPVKFYRRYVDDTFVILDRNHVEEFHSVLNSIESSINFTYEVEQGGKLPFLDICVCRDSTGSIHTCVYRKPCDTGTFLSFESHHPTEHKRSVVRTLLHRSEQLSSCSELRACEDATISASLDKRGYPHRFIEDTRKRMQPRKPQDGDRSRLTRVTIPYVKGVSESIRRALLPLEIWTTFRPHVKLRSLISKPKDIVAPEDQSGVVYKLQCLDCDTCYIGETGRKRRTRIKEHKSDVRNATHATRLKTELSEHSWNTGHCFDYDNAVTLAREQRWGPRKLLESWHIRADPLHCNKNRGPLPEQYCHLLK
ncbi:uncharacterized protein LOC135384497 [Ornithodoros turicata]|uniref:uncharacterized protein LOC135384497 n=1 Tax=Ornithodoros turicata TaxID=34597 RepID=UPI003138BA25